MGMPTLRLDRGIVLTAQVQSIISRAALNSGRVFTAAELESLIVM